MPFAITAPFNDKDEPILHFGAVRLRITGAGNLDMQFQSLDTVKTQTLAPLPMSSVTDREPVKLANFKSQRAMLKISTDEINEIFRINRIILFVKPLWSQYFNG